MGITKGERAELRGVVRNQFKVLRHEVIERQAELFSQIESEITSRFADNDANWAACQHAVHEAVMEANRRINDALREHGYEMRGHTERMWLTEPTMRKPDEERHQLRQTATAKINAQVKAASLRLDRQEADLLRTLAMGALETEEARAFLGEIPSVSELVPGSRLAELEASLGDDANDG